jgi:hypothetical protein
VIVTRSFAMMWARVVVPEVVRHVTHREDRRRPQPSSGEFAGGEANHAAARVPKMSGSLVPSCGGP